MLDAVNRYLPSPLDIKAIVGTQAWAIHQVVSRTSTKQIHEPFSALAFKIMRRSTPRKINLRSYLLWLV